MSLASRASVMLALAEERASLRRRETALAFAEKVSRGTLHDKAQVERIAADRDRCAGRVAALEQDLAVTELDAPS